VLIEPLKYYEKPVDDNTAYIDVTDEGILRTMLFRKISGAGRERSISHLLPEETEKIIRLLERVNEGEVSKLKYKPYPQTKREEISIELGKGPIVKFETILEAWMMENIDKDYDVLKDVIGPSKEVEYFGNNVLYGIGGEKSDILITHVDENNIRFKATVIELKKKEITNDAIDQIYRYAYWISQLVTANYVLSHDIKELILQPVVIGFTLTEKSRKYAYNFLQERKIKIPYYGGKGITVKVQPIKIILYKVSKNKITFEIKKIQ